MPPDGARHGGGGPPKPELTEDEPMPGGGGYEGCFGVIGGACFGGGACDGLALLVGSTRDLISIKSPPVVL